MEPMAELWHPVDPLQHPLAQFADTHVSHQREWTYIWSEELKRLRRVSVSDPSRAEHIWCRTMPTSTLALTQRFYRRRQWAPWPDRPNKGQRRLPSPLRLRGAKERRVMVVDPGRLSRRRMEMVWRCLQSMLDLPIMPLSQDARVAEWQIKRKLEYTERCLVTALIPSMGGVSLEPTLHVTPISMLPEGVRWAHDTLWRTPPDARIVEIVPNPKRMGSRSRRRYDQYQVGMTFNDYASVAGVDRRKARHDWQYDWERQYIKLAGPDGKLIIPGPLV